MKGKLINYTFIFILGAITIVSVIFGIKSIKKTAIEMQKPVVKQVVLKYTGSEAPRKIAEATKTYKCTYTGNPQLPILQAIVYVNEKTTRTNINTLKVSNVVQTSTLENEDFFYIWATDRDTGMSVNKTVASKDDRDKLVESIGGNLDKISKMRDDMDITCEAWEYEPNMMTLPKDTVFLDYTKMAEKVRTERLEACEACYTKGTVAEQQECRVILTCDVIELVIESSEARTN